MSRSLCRGTMYVRPCPTLSLSDRGDDYFQTFSLPVCGAD